MISPYALLVRTSTPLSKCSDLFSPLFPSCVLLYCMFKLNLWSSDPEVDALYKKRKWKPTWVRQDGVCLRQKLVTTDALVSFSAPDVEKKKEPSVNESGLFGSNCHKD